MNVSNVIEQCGAGGRFQTPPTLSFKTFQKSYFVYPKLLIVFGCVAFIKCVCPFSINTDSIILMQNQFINHLKIKAMKRLKIFFQNMMDLSKHTLSDSMNPQIDIKSYNEKYELYKKATANK